MTLNILKDEINYNHRVLTSISLDQYKNRLVQTNYIIISLNNIYYTASYQRIVWVLREKANELINEREKKGAELANLYKEFISLKVKNKILMDNNNDEIDILMKKTSFVDDPHVSLDDLVGDDDMDAVSLDSLIDDNSN